MRERDFKKLTESLKTSNADFSERDIPYKGGLIKILYISQLTNRPVLSENVVKPLILHCSSVHEAVSAKQAVDSIIFADDCKIESDTDQIETHVLSGMTVILFSTDKEYIVANFKIVEHRSVPDPELTYTLRGARDCFTENMNVNLSLLRYRVQDHNLQIKHLIVGERSKSQVAIIYIEDIANETVVNEVQKRVQAIHVDGIGDSGDIQNHLLDHPYKPFPQMGLVERSDMAFQALMEGKVLVMVDGSSILLETPKVFSEYFYSSDDRYDNKLFGFFARLVRYLSIFISLTSSSMYIAITSFHTEVLPGDYAVLLASLRSNVPFTALIGALLLEFVMELLKESLLRVPRQVGPAIGIVGAIVIGQAAIAAGVFNPILLMISAASLLTSFAIPDYSFVNPIRISKFFLMLLTGFFGFYGMTIGLMVILTELVSMNSFGVPFMAPLAPYIAKDFPDTLIDRTNHYNFRQSFLRLKDNKRAR